MSEPAIGIVGSGSWGTALAQVLARSGHDVILWGRDGAAMARIARSRVNGRYLPGILLHPAIRFTADILALDACRILLLAVPAQKLRETVRGIEHRGRVLVVCAKGLERTSHRRLSEVLAEECPDGMPAALSGPSFASEVARGLPTALTVAAPAMALARELAEELGSSSFRLYPCDDLIGVEIAGALKNVIAIAAGIVMGRGFGENARAALITRGLAEITRLGMALGARRETLAGLSGMGDLVLTATSLTSRNTRFGFELGCGAPLDSLLGEDAPLCEGVWTARAACRMAAAHDIELPVSEAVARILERRWSVNQAITALLSRPPAASE
ncbi:MAG TPA: NAD(P)-dependent glycerol-3-phosphate dehydrogenase [Rhodospirillales bacterium]|nr:NAD(P)-dependent glycerol-3-phosphate dehydrogenase [Rhodospirillales bacterium]